MMSLLAFVKNQAVLLTGLNNPQVVRTADIMDMVCIVFACGASAPHRRCSELAEQRGPSRFARGEAACTGILSGRAAGRWRPWLSPDLVWNTRARRRFHPRRGGLGRPEAHLEKQNGLAP